MGAEVAKPPPPHPLPHPLLNLSGPLVAERWWGSVGGGALVAECVWPNVSTGDARCQKRVVSKTDGTTGTSGDASLAMSNHQKRRTPVINQTLTNNRVKNRSVRRARLLAGLLVAALVASACSASDDESGSSGGLFEERTESTRYPSSSRTSESSDADEGFVTDSASGDAAEAMDEEAMSDAMADDEEFTAPPTSPASTNPAAVEGGFFANEPPPEPETQSRQDSNTFKDYGVRSFIDTDRDPLSTFALDVDSASYFIGRQFLLDGVLPPSASVRVEEYVNAFDYDYPSPKNGLTVVADAGPSPFNPDNVIVRLGVQAQEITNRERADANLTFVVDTSGSMDRDDRLGLVKIALKALVEELDRNDTVAIVTYSNAGDIILPPTSVGEYEVIIEAIDRLHPGGSTNLEAGLEVGYSLANEAFQRGATNRVILASDGVANVGLTDPDGLAAQIRGDADSGIQLVTIGVGMGNFNDVVMETLANDGDGFYAYVNDKAQARKLFTEDLLSNLVTVAVDGKIQVEFDSDNVVSYRLLGFENRAVLDSDFRNDSVDAGELGAGHQVTALYELELARGVRSSDRLGTVALRWEDPDTRDVRETRLELAGGILQDSWTQTGEDFRLAVTVAAYAEILRQSQYAQDLTLARVAKEANALAGQSDMVAELVDLIREADRRS